MPSGGRPVAAGGRRREAQLLQSPTHGPLTPRSAPRSLAQVPEWLIGTTAPVLYYEQGHEWLFGDPMRFQARALRCCCCCRRCYCAVCGCTALQTPACTCRGVQAVQLRLLPVPALPCLQDAGDYAAQDHLFHQAMHLPVALAAVSGASRP